MNPERWLRIDELFHAALAREPAARSAFLIAACGADSALRFEVQALLAADHRAGSFLEHAAATDLRNRLIEYQALIEKGRPQTGEATRPDSAPLAKQTVGAYTLESPIGHGGMGTVWLARRSDGRFEGRAAVKFMNAALMGSAAEERFKREGSILARLTHPNIAHLIDAGVSAG